MALDVIGAGFGRTGTLSLKLALERLGYDRCYHMLEVRENPSHVGLWRRATDGQGMDWDALFEGYRATVDWPASAFWRQLASHYPEAKVILSLRDPERWYRSVHDTIYQAMTMELPDDAPEAVGEQMAMVRRLVLERTFEDGFEDETHAIEVFNRHNAEVKAAFDEDRLLVFEASEGWEPLCKFLGKPIPEEDFPRVNDSASFKQRFGMKSD
jgi:hypothetical protein